MTPPSDYDGDWEEFRDSDEFGEWLIDGDAHDPELNGTALYDQLLEDYDEHPDDGWDGGESGGPVLGLAAAGVGGAASDSAVRFGPAATPRTDTPADPDVWHLTHSYNFQLMCAAGFLSPTPDAPWGVRPGNPDLVGERARRPTELGPMVGEFVPFHFTVATPFSYRVLTPGWTARLVEPAGVRTIITQPEHYVFLRSTIRRVVVDGASDWIITNGNAATGSTKAWRSLRDLHRVDWSAVTSRWAPTNQAARQAELLVARRVDLNALIGVHCATVEMADWARGVAGAWADRVVLDRESFVRARGG